MARRIPQWKKIGEWKGFSKQGYEVERQFYNTEGLRNGTSYKFLSDGELISVENFKDGVRHGNFIHYSEGKIYSIQHFEYGEVVSEQKSLSDS